MDSHPYARLSPLNDEIRVLHLLPGPHGDDLTGELEVISLSALDIWKYEALSYTWGAPSTCHAIRLHGHHHLQVTKNLHAALRRLRKQDMARTLWIDAICINQQDNEERSDQVSRMGDVYRLAANVIVWLGDTEPAEPAWRRLQYTRLGYVWQGLWRDISYGDFLNGFPAKTRAFAPQSAALRAAVRNVRAHWWERAWILQEVALASRDPCITFGSYELAWGKLNPSDAAMQECDEFLEALQSIKSTRSEAQEGYRPSILSFADNLIRSKATDPRDKVYSLLSMVDAAEASLINIDYSTPCAEVYAKATFAIIAANSELSVLLYIANDTSASKALDPEDRPARRTGRRLPGLPSWAIDFTFGGYPKLYNLGGLWENIFKHSRHRITAHATLQTDPTGLTVRGLYLDSIAAVVQLPAKWYSGSLAGGEKRHQTNIMIPKINAALRVVCSHERLDNYADSSGSACHKAAPLVLPTYWDWLLLVTECWTASMEGEISGEGTFEVLFEAWDVLRQGDAARRDAWLSSLPKRGRQVHGEYFLCTYWWDQYLDIAAGNGVFFVTMRGFLGLGSTSMRKDDAVTFLYGSRAPAVLRANNDHHTFRGLSYVHGIMKEPIEECFDTAIPEQRDFLLH